MSLRKIYQLEISGGSPHEEKILRTPCREIDSIDDHIREIITDMRDTIAYYPFCRGLSAPQIGESLAISIIDIGRVGANGDILMINPKVIGTMGKKDKKRESCLFGASKEK